SQVTDHVLRGAADTEYEKIRPTYPDTVEGQWQLAEWCREHSLNKQRRTHLERIIVLDPNHKQARAALDYRFIDGRWIQPDDLMKQRGYVRYKNTWKLPQEVDLIEARHKEEAAELEWRIKVKRWRGAIEARPDFAKQMTDDLFANAGAAAVPAVKQMLGSESDRKVKILLINTLVKLGTADALAVVAMRTLDDDDEEVRLSSLDALRATKHPELTSSYVKALKSSDNLRVNRAAYCLGILNDKSAIIPLIDALRTRHKFKDPGSGNPGQMTTTFGSGPGGGGGGLAVGGGPKEVKVWLENHEVLKALIAITGENFEFNETAWKNWYARQNKPATLDARRGE
ncbi:MAG TPA: HEAT repeat domain-containing protein, partial [Pirellulales bacterium]|nr:HEAT repeat domain-containing protein [Pirellulales bacterium]